MAKNDLRSQLKPTSIKRLQKQIDSDDAMVGAKSNEFLNLEDGKTIKIRIFPAHPGNEDFYVARKCYWLSFQTQDGEMRRGTVLDSKMHGGTKYDVVEEYVKYAKKHIDGDAEKLEALVGTGPKSNSLNPQYTWMCYADKIDGDNPLRAKVWEFKKMVRDALNRLAFNEDDDEPIDVDPFTDVDEGLPVLVTYRKKPNKKKGENYYDVSFPKKVSARPLTDDEIEYFMSLKPIQEVVGRYGIRDFEKALEGLQNFDEENEIGLFDDDNWLEHLEEIKSQYDSEEPEQDEEEDEKPKKNSKKSSKKEKEPEPEEEDEDEEAEEEESEEDEFTDMDRNELKKYISKNKLDITVKKSMSDEEIRNLIRANNVEEKEEEPEEEEEDDEEEVPAKITLDDIRKKLKQ
jgi:hypothetical protein